MNWMANDIGNNVTELIKFFGGSLMAAIAWLFNRLIKHWDELSTRVNNCEKDIVSIKAHIGIEEVPEKAQAAKA